MGKSEIPTRTKGSAFRKREQYPEPALPLTDTLLRRR
jgi:hypothetical protein